MGMGGDGGTGRAVSEINVTPLIDVLLVLLIIFMVIVPAASKGLDASIPQPPKDKSAPPPDTTIVVTVQGDGKGGEPSYRVNQEQFAKSQIEPKLAEIFSTRHEKVMFVKADAALEFSTVAEVIDMGHQAGVVTIGLITPHIEAR